MTTSSCDERPELSTSLSSNPISLRYKYATFDYTQMPLSATLVTRNVGDEQVAAAASTSGTAGSSNTIQSLVAQKATPAPFTAAEALQAALTTRYAASASSSASLPLPQWPSKPAAAETEGAATKALQATQQSQSSHVVMSTLGFGIDLGHGGNSSWSATEASIRALRDAMERSTLRLPFLATLSDKQLQLHVKLGVPPKNALNPTEPMVVDMAAVTAVLPQSIPLDTPIQVVVGGLAVPSMEGGEPPVCSAIASVSITTNAEPKVPSAIESWASQEVEQKKPPAKLAATAKTASDAPGRVDSMSMLARISSAVRDNPDLVTGSDHFVAAVAAVENCQDRKLSMDLTVEGDTSTGGSSRGSDQYRQQRKRSAPSTRSDSSPKSKLRPGLTTKKNTRQFVQHDYHDHANEMPLPGESPTGPLDVENVAFPYKMHDTLTRIEADGYGDIMSWLPHGRSFKIHDLDGFHETVLPMYFRHSKKSSLLRQLNLYGFRRICAGPDKGSYYHELFLRGKRFLAGRMRRCKVNGKRIRSAGNPETEPIFSTMEPMPLTSGPILNIHTVSSDVSASAEEEEDPYLEQDEGNMPVGPVSYKNLTFPFKLHALLDLLELKGENSIISWLPHGRAFCVNDSNAFVRVLLPRFFGISKFSSFHRQMLQYGFTKSPATAGGAYYHSSFIRGMPRLCREMRRCTIFNKNEATASQAETPEFFTMPAIPSVDATLVELPLDMPELPILNGMQE